jgi:hypothetical protein
MLNRGGIEFIYDPAFSWEDKLRKHERRLFSTRRLNRSRIAVLGGTLIAIVAIVIVPVILHEAWIPDSASSTSQPASPLKQSGNR